MLRCLGLRRFTAAGSARAGCLSQMPQNRDSAKEAVRTLHQKHQHTERVLVCVMIAKAETQNNKFDLVNGRPCNSMKSPNPFSIYFRIISPDSLASSPH